MPKRIRSVTLIELIIAVALISVITIGFSSIELFSRYHVLTSERRAKLQNEVSYALEHMSKNISRAIGNEMVNGVNSVVMVVPNVSLRVYIDANGDGQRQDPVNNPTANADHYLAYRYDATGANQYRIRYCGRCRNANCNFNQCMDTVETLSRQITDFTPFKPRINPGVDDTLSDNFVEIGLTACWDPDGVPQACGTPDNPSVTMTNRIKMPSVSTN